MSVASLIEHGQHHLAQRALAAVGRHDPDPGDSGGRHGCAAGHGHVEREDAPTADNLVAVVRTKCSLGLDGRLDVAEVRFFDLFAVCVADRLDPAVDGIGSGPS